MNLNEEVELLKTVPIFRKMEPARLKLLAFTSERMNFGEGQEVCRQGDPGDKMYVILGGVADVLINSPSGQITVAQMKKNSFFGDMAILLDVPRTATIKAVEPLSTLMITKDTFYKLVAEIPEMAIEVMRELAHRLDDANNKLSEATAKKAT